ncbi:MAG TPA: hypothetical protein PLJ35_10245 [Anaerolineae bacterium]|nr:hypothetical protein [Anaerolineae bacterium]HOQ99185.1 hypothetical protein [Anaerolineae bacterium]HPL29553.1 hypothetical protein [Anaerolineae bacterium]
MRSRFLLYAERFEQNHYTSVFSTTQLAAHVSRTFQAVIASTAKQSPRQTGDCFAAAVEKLPVCHCEEAAADEAMTVAVSVLAHAARRHGILAMTGQGSVCWAQGSETLGYSQ